MLKYSSHFHVCLKSKSQSTFYTLSLYYNPSSNPLNSYHSPFPLAPYLNLVLSSPLLGCCCPRNPLRLNSLVLPESESNRKLRVRAKGAGVIIRTLSDTLSLRSLNRSLANSLSILSVLIPAVPGFTNP